MTGFIGGILLWLALAMLALPVSAEERILSYESTIQVRKDSSLKVSEKIRVRAEGRNIRRGIYRDFPVRYIDESGYQRHVGFKVISITRDDKPEPWFSQGSGDHRRVYIGEESVYLKHGDYTYNITYETTRQLRYFEDYDELYWNVTGNKWAFPIDKAIAHIELPEGATIINRAGFTGRFGDKGSNFAIRSEGINSITFETTSPLGFFEGLTVAIGWPKGVVPEPGPVAGPLWRMWDNIGYVFLLAGTLGITVYFYIIWRRIGRDPEGGAIFPRFKAPGDLSPAAISYLHYMGFRRASSGATKPFVAALVSLAVKGYITMDDSGDDMKITKTDISGKPPLASGEQALFSRLLGHRDELVFKQSSHTIVQSARSKFKAALTGEHGNVFFRNNYGWFGVGLAASIAIVGIAMVLIQLEEVTIFLGFLTLLAAAGALVLSMGFRRLSNWLPGGDSIWMDSFLIVLGTVLLVVPFVVVLAVERAPAWIPLCGIALGVMNVAFLHLLRAPTVLGRQMMDAIDGFKMYLSVAEAERMNMNDAPVVSQEIFEKFLPFAIGLGVEKPWSKAFENHLAKTRPDDGGSHYHPHWYSGSSGWDSGRLATTTAGIVGAVSAGMAAASPPSSSGSSGGGGFSGGGGGGGGGGGW